MNPGQPGLQLRRSLGIIYGLHGRSPGLSYGGLYCSSRVFTFYWFISFILVIMILGYGMQPLWIYLFNIVRKYRGIYVRDRRLTKKNLFKYNPLQAILVDMFLNPDKCICKEAFCGKDYRSVCVGDRCLDIVVGNGDVCVELVYPCKNACLIDLGSVEHLFPDTPLFIVDLSLYNVLHEKDRNRLVHQVNLFLKAMRRYLIDKYLILNNAPEEFIQKFNLYAGPNKTVYTSDQELAAIIKKLDNIIILDPYGQQVATTRDIERAEAVVIGGIVDREKPLKRATEKIAHRLSKPLGREIPRLRLEINGIREAVPHRINIIGEILFTTIFEQQPLDKAIIKHMSNRDTVWYIGLLLARNKIKNEEIPQLINEIEKIKGRRINPKVIEKAYRIAGMKT